LSGLHRQGCGVIAAAEVPGKPARPGIFSAMGMIQLSTSLLKPWVMTVTLPALARTCGTVVRSSATAIFQIWFRKIVTMSIKQITVAGVNL
jgi:hypothetical protein